MLLQLAGSLAAVFAVAWLVRAMGLGGEARIRSTEQALALAEDAECGFGGVEAALDKAGYAAIVRNAAGRQMLIRAHGTQFAARPIDADVTGRLDKTFLTLSVPERTFGPVTLQLGRDAALWASRLRDVGARG